MMYNGEERLCQIALGKPSGPYYDGPTDIYFIYILSLEPVFERVVFIYSMNT